MKKRSGTAALIWEFSQLAQAKDGADFLSLLPDSRNDLQSAAMHDRALVVQAGKQHIKRHHYETVLRRAC